MLSFVQAPHSRLHEPLISCKSENIRDISFCWMLQMSQSEETVSLTKSTEKDYTNDDVCLASLKLAPRREQQQYPEGQKQQQPHLSHESHNIMVMSKVDQMREKRVVPKLVRAQLDEGDNIIADVDSLLFKQRQDSALHPNLSVPTTLHDAATLCQQLESYDIEGPDGWVEHDLQKSKTEQQDLMSKCTPIHSSVTSAIPLPPDGGETLKTPSAKTQNENLDGIESAFIPCTTSNQSHATIRHTHSESRDKKEKLTKAPLSHTQSEAITEPTRFDILCGQSKNLNNHPGNRRFQVILNIYTPKYRSTKSRQERMLIIKEIIACVHSSGGRFLKYNKGVFEEISSIMARDKISHALRNRI